MTHPNYLRIKRLSSLAKVFPDRICGRTASSAEAAWGQAVSFQLALRLELARYGQRELTVKIRTDLPADVSLFRVGNVPSELPAYPDRKDKNYITDKPGLFPDPLFPIGDGRFTAAVGSWRALWLSIAVKEGCPAGRYPVDVVLSHSGEELATARFFVTVHAVSPPSQKLIFTQWFHCDCIADAHGVKVFSEAHWSLIEAYMRLAAAHGMNMILTPVLTPPLDTAVGTERPTVQLVDIERTDTGYRFDFSKLSRYVTLARACGIEHFEINPFFTQWGAAHAPKVVAKVGNRQKRIFGWETDSQSEEYLAFLRALIPALITHLGSIGVKEEHIFFHVSDEPNAAHLETYRRLAAVLHPLIGACRQIDALSDPTFLRDGLVRTPVVATNHIEPFLQANVEDLWCYYCCGQGVDVSNRFFAMPSARTRIIGVQMYQYGIKGFLHWGYNFYYTQLSKRRIDPYCVTDGGAAFPSGDAFSVYPYEDGAIPSLRQKVFAKALEDMRLLELAEEKLGRDTVIQQINTLAGMNITFSHYPNDERFFDDLYRFVFTSID